jgi:hypothetical protein
MYELQKMPGVIHSRWIGERLYVVEVFLDATLWIYAWGEDEGYRTAIGTVAMKYAQLQPVGLSCNLAQMVEPLLYQYAAGELPTNVR